MHVKINGAFIAKKNCTSNDILFKISIPVTPIDYSGGFIYDTTGEKIIPVILYPDGSVKLYDDTTLAKDYWVSTTFAYFVLPL